MSIGHIVSQFIIMHAWNIPHLCILYCIVYYFQVQEEVGFYGLPLFISFLVGLSSCIPKNGCYQRVSISLRRFVALHLRPHTCKFRPKRGQIRKTNTPRVLYISIIIEAATITQCLLFVANNSFHMAFHRYFFLNNIISIIFNNSLHPLPWRSHEDHWRPINAGPINFFYYFANNSWEVRVANHLRLFSFCYCGHFCLAGWRLT